MRLLVVNIGNSTLFGGFYLGKQLSRCFRVPIGRSGRPAGFLRQIAVPLKARPARIVLCSVVPRLTAPISRSLERCTGIKPEILDAASPHGLRINYDEPSRFGTDRLAAALGAQALYPDKNIIIVDCGTATTVTALDRGGIIKGGAILPGLGLWAQALARGTAQLPAVRPAKPRSPLGQSPEQAIASGLYHGHAGAIRHLSKAIAGKAFGSSRYIVLGTGGMAPVFASEKLFTRMEPNLILAGLQRFAALQQHA